MSNAIFCEYIYVMGPQAPISPTPEDNENSKLRSFEKISPGNIESISSQHFKRSSYTISEAVSSKYTRKCYESSRHLSSPTRLACEQALRGTGAGVEGEPAHTALNFECRVQILDAKY